MLLDTNRNHMPPYRCSLLVLVCFVAALALAGCRAPAPTDGLDCTDCNLLVISIDTLRADHLGTYGYHRDTSPNLDAFAARSVVFENAYSTSHATADAHMSIFTSVYPAVHRVRNARDVWTPVVRLSPLIPTLPELLQAQGFTTVGLHGSGNIEGLFGFERGFDDYRHVKHADRAIEWVNQHQDDRFFLFFHTHRVHDPYTPSPPYDKLYDPDYEGDLIASEEKLWELVGEPDFAKLHDLYWGAVDPENEADIRHVIALYDGEINEVDIEVSKLIDAVLARYPRTIVVLTSDHGEEFQEHGYFAHLQLYDELLRVPLIVHVPPGDPEAEPVSRRVGQRVSTVNVAPTVLDLLGFEVPETFMGSSLRPAMAGVLGEDETIVAEKVYEILDGRSGVEPDDPRRMAMIVGSRKVMLTDKVEVFDLVTDPDETENLADTAPDMRRLVAGLRAKQAEHDALMESYYPEGSAMHEELDEQTIQRLKALGYID